MKKRTIINAYVHKEMIKNTTLKKTTKSGRAHLHGHANCTGNLIKSKFLFLSSDHCYISIVIHMITPNDNVKFVFQFSIHTSDLASTFSS